MILPFLQAATRGPVVGFIEDYPGVAATLIGSLVSLMSVLIAFYHASIFKRLGALEAADIALVARVHGVEVVLMKYQEHVGVGDQALTALTRKIEAHMAEEETRVWGGIREINEKLNAMAVESLKRHAELIAVHGAKIASLEARVDNNSTRLAELQGQLTGKNRRVRRP